MRDERRDGRTAACRGSPVTAPSWPRSHRLWTRLESHSGRTPRVSRASGHRMGQGAPGTCCWVAREPVVSGQGPQGSQLLAAAPADPRFLSLRKPPLLHGLSCTSPLPCQGKATCGGTASLAPRTAAQAPGAPSGKESSSQVESPRSPLTPDTKPHGRRCAVLPGTLRAEPQWHLGQPKAPSLIPHQADRLGGGGHTLRSRGRTIS